MVNSCQLPSTWIPIPITVVCVCVCVHAVMVINVRNGDKSLFPKVVVTSLKEWLQGLPVWFPLFWKTKYTILISN